MILSLRLRGISNDVKGKTWESDCVLRAGRLVTLEIALDGISISRRHAEIRMVNDKWWVCDLDSTTGTYLNGVRLDTLPHQLRSRDIIHFGKVAMLVEIGHSVKLTNGAASDHLSRMS